MTVNEEEALKGAIASVLLGNLDAPHVAVLSQMLHGTSTIPRGSALWQYLARNPVAGYSFADSPYPQTLIQAGSKSRVVNNAGERDKAVAEGFGYPFGTAADYPATYVLPGSASKTVTNSKQELEALAAGYSLSTAPAYPAVFSKSGFPDRRVENDSELAAAHSDGFAVAPPAPLAGPAVFPQTFTKTGFPDRIVTSAPMASDARLAGYTGPKV